MFRYSILLVTFLIFHGFIQKSFSQNSEELIKKIDALEKKIAEQQHNFDKLEKQIDDLAWQNRLGDIAYVDKVYITGPPLAKIKNPNAVGANNPVKFWNYVFVPRNIDRNKKYPLIILPHGGVHSNFSTYYTHIVRELIAQGYIVSAPEYRGSTGYGKSFYEMIDYGGREVGDTDASREYMVENYPFVDKNRVGLIGWSHGGMITLMCLFEYPEKYKVGFAGVPVSDLIMRFGYHGEDYLKYFDADYHIGKSPLENTEEYKKRSPVFHAEKLLTPLMINTNTNDDDVFAIEVMNLINALKAEGKKFEYDVYKDMPGGHSFERIDIRSAREIRWKTYEFLAKYLEPPNKFKSLSELEIIAYPGR